MVIFLTVARSRQPGGKFCFSPSSSLAADVRARGSSSVAIFRFCSASLVSAMAQERKLTEIMPVLALAMCCVDDWIPCVAPQDFGARAQARNNTRNQAIIKIARLVWCRSAGLMELHHRGPQKIMPFLKIFSRTARKKTRRNETGEITWQGILIFRCSRRVFCTARTSYDGKSPARSFEMKFFGNATLIDFRRDPSIQKIIA